MTVPAVREDFALLDGALSTIGLKLDPDTPYKQFENICFVLGKMHEAVRFAIGDAIMQGEALYGEQAYQAFEQLNISEDAMKEYVRVSTRVPRSTRRASLSWSHHRAVASLEPPRQKEWLRRAADEGLSHHALREALREEGVAPSAVTPSSCRCCGRPL